MNNTNNIGCLLDWVNSQMIRGKYIFTREDVQKIGLPIKDESISRSLRRLISKGTIMSPWQNFFVIVPTMYQLRGVVPVHFYIDQLMHYLGRNYYVSMLSAAELLGASHQKAMVYQVTVDGAPIQSKIMNRVSVMFTRCQNLPLKYCTQVRTQTGNIWVSDKELTALDIVEHEVKIGGISRAAEVLSEIENMHWGKDQTELLTYFSTPTIQRLGYLLEQIEATKQADQLWNLLQKSGRIIRKIPLKQTQPVNNQMSIDEKWHIIINTELELDEL